MASKEEHYELAEEFSLLAVGAAGRQEWDQAHYYTRQALVHAELSQ